MSNYAIRIFSGVAGAAISTPAIGAIAALGGFIYAKFADLPPQQVALAFAIWHAAETALVTIASTFSQNKKEQLFIRATILTISSVVGLCEMQKKALIGTNGIVLLLAIRSIGISKIIYARSS